VIVPGGAHAIGAYGIALPALEEVRELLVPAAKDWPTLELEQVRGRATATLETVGDRSARLILRNGGEIEVEREGPRALFRVPERLGPAELLHPYLAPVASVVAHWSGRESLHAAAIVVDGAAWALLGDRESGKSSTAAWLARAGVGVLCDDVLVLDGGSALAGPRVIDLREEPARLLEAGEELGVVGERERWRLRLDPVPAAVPLAGWVSLAWGERVAVESVPAAARIAMLVAQRGLRVPASDPALLVELAALPALELRRPRDWSSLAEAAGRLLDRLGR
jgi:hypothetical protein